VPRNLFISLLYAIIALLSYVVQRHVVQCIFCIDQTTLQ